MPFTILVQAAGCPLVRWFCFPPARPTLGCGHVTTFGVVGWTHYEDLLLGHVLLVALPT